VFGRFASHPYVQQINDVGFPCVNLGLSGARPEHYLQQNGLEDILVNSDVLLIEFMSARGYKTRFYTPNNIWGNIGDYTSPMGKKLINVFVDRAWEYALNDYGGDTVSEEIVASRKRYVNELDTIVKRFGKKVIFLWISQRELNYKFIGRKFKEFSGWFPHFVDQDTVSHVVNNARNTLGQENVEYVELTSTTGLPQTLFNRWTGAPEKIISDGPMGHMNFYYPSPEMHDEAAQRILPILQKIYYLAA
jgi:hypothetical protein